MSKQKTTFPVDERFLHVAKNYLSYNDKLKLDGLSVIGAGDLRLWFRDENDKLNCILLPAQIQEVT
ncbi:MAG: hypothetical protein Q7R95_11215 [bacterium]|nr:hypothetical protein [bacterium]